MSAYPVCRTTRSVQRTGTPALRKEGKICSWTRTYRDVGSEREQPGWIDHGLAPAAVRPRIAGSAHHDGGLVSAPSRQAAHSLPAQAAGSRHRHPARTRSRRSRVRARRSAQHRSHRSTRTRKPSLRARGQSRECGRRCLCRRPRSHRRIRATDSRQCGRFLSSSRAVVVKLTLTIRNPLLASSLRRNRSDLDVRPVSVTVNAVGLPRRPNWSRTPTPPRRPLRRSVEPGRQLHVVTSA